MLKRSTLALSLAALTLAAAGAQKVRPNSIQVNPAGPSVTSLTLMDVGTNRPVPGYDPIPQGATLDLGTLPAKLNVRANTAGGPLGSVRFALDGNASYKLENGAPYALCSDTRGAYFACPANVFSVGQHRLAATPTTGMNGGGTVGAGAAVAFSVVRSEKAAIAVTGLTLINAETDQPVPGYDPIPAGAALRLSALPRQLNIRANVTPGVGSVRFTLSGAQDRLENEAPFALCSDTNNKNGNKGAYFACAGNVLSPGAHTLSATPYPQLFGKGAPGQALSWTFTVER